MSKSPVPTPGYEILETLSESRRTTVYRARDKKCGDTVILKCLTAPQPTSRDLLRFRREFDIGRHLEGDEFVHILGLEHHHNSMIVEEDFGAESLEKSLQTRRFDLQEFLVLALDIARALGRLHEQDVVHRDINPSNIVWNPTTGQVKLIDFGLAAWSRELQTGGPLAQTLGTLPYISPEQTGRTSRLIDYRTDYYSLGATLYELVTGTKPFDEQDLGQMVHAHLARYPIAAHHRRQHIPVQISKLLSKLMSKAAEERYQSGRGLVADLTRCLDDYLANRKISEFELGQQDLQTTLHISHRLYGRKEEMQRLENSFHHIQKGGRHLTLVKGAAGAGKSTLVEHLQAPVLAEDGLFVTGKFEHLQNTTPYIAIAEAFGTLLTRLLSSYRHDLARWKSQLRSALGDDEPLLAYVVPELELILDDISDAPVIDAEEGRHRLQHAFSRFVGVFATPSTPLVVALDDLQWADEASLELLQFLLTDDKLQHLLIIGTYRPNEVDARHRFSNFLGHLSHHSVPVDSIDIDGLGDEAITDLVADSLDVARADAHPLAALVASKTSGNPYFIGQFLRDLVDRKLLWFDADAGAWHWDTEEIALLSVTDNVVDMLQRRIEDLPSETIAVLVDAAFLGTHFEVEVLADVCELSVAETYRRLLAALDAEIVVSCSELELLESEDSRVSMYFPSLFFPHDRLREATARLVDSDTMASHQLRIGRRLQQRFEKTGDDQLLFAAVQNLNEAGPCIDDPREILTVVKLNHRAAQMAFQRQAIAEAARHLHQATKLIDDDVWQQLPDIAADVLRLHAEAALLLGEFEASRIHVEDALERIDDPIVRADLYGLAIRRLTLQSSLDEATELGRMALQQLGESLPLTDLDDAVEAEFSRIEQRLGDRTIDEITEIANQPDARIDAASRLLGILQPAAGLLDFRLLLLVGLKATNLTLDVGIRPESSVGLAMYGTALCLRDQPERGYQAGELAIELAREYDRKSNLTHAAFLFGSMILPWSKPLSDSLPLFEEGYRAGLHSGNHLFAGYNRFLHVLHQFYLGRDLGEVLRQATEAHDINQTFRNTAGVDLSMGLRMITHNLMGDTDSVDTYGNDDAPSAEQFIERCKGHNTHSAIAVFCIARAQINYIHGRSAAALEELEALQGALDPLLGTFDTGRHPFYHALALIDVHLKSPPDQRRKVRRTLTDLRERLVQLETHCPANFEARLLLVDAELARFDQNIKDTIDGYDQAIAAARKQKLIHLEALANERAGLFWLEQKKHDFASLYLRDACDLYGLWNAHRKTEQLRDQFDRLISRASSITGSMSSSSSGDAIDIDSVFQASEVIARQLDIQQLLPALMEVTLENAGAERGTFIVTDDHKLAVAIQGRVGDEPIPYDPPLALDDWDGGPRSVIRFVHRTRKPLVLNRAHRDPRFRTDPYLRQRQVRSLFCIPAEEHGDLKGILYVENNLADDAFNEERIRILKILAGHIAIALNRARLYDRLQEKKERFRQLAENIRDVFWLMDYPSREITYLSPAYETVWGRPIPSYPISVDQWLEPIIDENRQEVREVIENDVATGAYDTIYRIQRPSGSLRWIHARGFPITDSDAQVHRIAGIARDITRERELAQMKDEFISVVSHELRTPLTPITGIFSMLTRDYEDQLPDEVNKMTELGLRNSRRLLSLIDDLLDIQKLSMEKVDLNFEILDVRDFVEEAIELNASLGETRNIRFKLQPFPETLCIRGDRGRLIQILTNLMSNAVKFSQPDDIIVVRIERVDDHVRISVIDHGPGIPVEVRDKIFEKFTQADSTLTRQHGGIGLGLAIARSLIDRLGGRIYFDTKLDEGTTFHVELPLLQAHPSHDANRLL